jgi:hypothetical protein
MHHNYTGDMFERLETLENWYSKIVGRYATRRVVKRSYQIYMVFVTYNRKGREGRNERE